MDNSKKCIEPEKPQSHAGFRVIAQDSFNNISEILYFA
jgi:hypothetical protein